MEPTKPRHTEGKGEAEAGASTDSSVAWQEVGPAASSVFNVWFSQPELKWAEATWRDLGRLGQTRYADEVGRHRVLIRLLALADIYLDFCAVAWEEDTAIFLSDFAESMRLSPFRLGQLVGRELESSVDDTDEELVKLALSEVVSGERRTLVLALRRIHGSTDATFVSLWTSRSDDWSGLGPESLGADVWTAALTPDASEPGKLAAHSWIDEGMPSYRSAPWADL